MEETIKDLTLSIQSRYPFICLLSNEEKRVERYVHQVAGTLKKQVFIWTHTLGITPAVEGMGEVKNPLQALAALEIIPKDALVLMKDFHPFLQDPTVLRTLRDQISLLEEKRITLLLLSPVLVIPVEIEKELHIIDIPLPGVSELLDVLDKVILTLKEEQGIAVSFAEDLRERVAKATIGLTEQEAWKTFLKVFLQKAEFDVEDVELIVREKRQLIRRSEFLEFCDLREDMDQVGGLDELKRWLKGRTSAFSEEARAFGLPEPKGLLLVGIQGCGKSLMAKAVARFWKVPLLRMDIADLFNTKSGTPEENMRKSIKVAESLSPAVLWIDEIEKGFMGVGGDAQSGSPSTARVFGLFITWLQEKVKPVFAIATANNIEGLPPELLRKGRFDEIFFLGLPNRHERSVIFRIHLGKRKQDIQKFDLDRLAEKSEKFSGSEIEQCIISALYSVFSEKRDLNMKDIEAAIMETVPLAVTMEEQINKLKDWARHRARPATSDKTIVDLFVEA